MVLMPWNLCRDIVDVGIDVEHETYFAAHPLPRLTYLHEPVGVKDDDEEDTDDRGRGRWRRRSS